MKILSCLLGLLTWVVPANGEWIASSRYGVRIPVPTGWTPRQTDTSLSLSSNHERNGSTVVVGVFISPNLAPWNNPGTWREQMLSSLVRYVESCSGRLLTPASTGRFGADTTQDATYLTLDLPTATLYAGRSRFLSHGGFGYELFYMGDTTALYNESAVYEAMLQSFEIGLPASLARSVAPSLEIHPVGGGRLRLQGVPGGQQVEIRDLAGHRVVPWTTARTDGTLEFPLPNATRLLLVRSNGWTRTVVAH